MPVGRILLLLSFLLIKNEVSKAQTQPSNGYEYEAEDVFFACDIELSKKNQKQEISLEIGMYSCVPVSVDTTKVAVAINELGDLRRVAIQPWISDLDLVSLLQSCKSIRRTREVVIRSDEVIAGDVQISFPSAEKITVEVPTRSSVAYETIRKLAPVAQTVVVQLEPKAVLGNTLVADLAKLERTDIQLRQIPINELASKAGAELLTLQQRVLVTEALKQIDGIPILLDIHISPKTGVSFSKVILGPNMVPPSGPQILAVAQLLKALKLKSCKIHIRDQAGRLLEAIPRSSLNVSIFGYHSTFNKYLGVFENIESLSLTGEIDQSTFDFVSALKSLKSLSLISSDPIILNISIQVHDFLRQLKRLNMVNCQMKESGNSRFQWESMTINKLITDQNVPSALLNAMSMRSEGALIVLPYHTLLEMMKAEKKSFSGLTVSTLYSKFNFTDFDDSDVVPYRLANRLVSLTNFTTELRFRTTLASMRKILARRSGE